MRGDASAEGPVLVRKVDAKGRLQLGASIKDLVPWLQQGREYIASTGPKGGLRIELRDAREAAEAGLPTDPLEEEQIGTALADYRRYKAFRWIVSIERGHWNLLMPEEVRKLGIAPGKRQEAIIFADGVLLEVWRRDDWTSHQREIARRRDEVLAEALEEG